MTEPLKHSANKSVDSLQQRLTDYACALDYASLTPEAIHAAKVCTIDTLGALIGGIFGEPGRVARNLAAQMPNVDGATVIGTRMKTTPDLAAFINGTTARFVEMTDVYHWPGAFGGHPSDTLTPVLAVAEHAQVSGREFISGVVLAYEIFLRFSDTLHDRGFDHTNFACLGTAVAAGKLLRLSPARLSHCIAMAIVPNNILGQVRIGHLSMFKSAATGQAGRAGVFAALLARAGMEGPHLPFEGKAGWCEHIAGKRFSIDPLGGNGVPFKILDLRFKFRSARGTTIPTILAAEKIAPIRNIKDVKRVTVEVYGKLKEQAATGEHFWNPDSRESAGHSAPYVVAVTLLDGKVTTSSFDDAHLWNPALRALVQKVEFVENEEFTQAYGRLPVIHRTRVTVVMNSGERLIGETGGDKDDTAPPKSDAEIEQKFREFTEDRLGAKRVNAILASLWHLDEVKNVAAIPSAFALG